MQVLLFDLAQQPLWVRASSITRFLDHTHTHTHNAARHSVGFLWTNDKFVTETST
jgi:hypothetical protein